MATLAPPMTETLEAGERSAFDRDGFVIARGLADAGLRQRMLDVSWSGIHQRIEPIEYEADLHYPGAPQSRAAKGGMTPRRLKQAHGRDAVFTEWLQHPLVVGRLKALLGSPLYCPLAHHNCVMTKQPQFSSETGWHQDIRFWSFTERNLVNVWLALGEERPENGCLRVIPGTHRITFSPERLDEDLFLRTDLPENQELIASAVDVELSAGDVLFFHCRTFHAAGANRAEETKLSVVFTYRGEGNPPLPGSRSASLPEMLIHT
jgi:phytanoyl-CoA hydroxylase